MKKLFCLIFIFSFSTVSHIFAQGQEKPAEARQHYFNFWVGNWDLHWEASDGTEANGKNKIEWVLNDKVLKENFEATSGSLKGYIGKSWSVYNPNTETWKQTWVDTQGSYLDFKGRKDGEKRFFERDGVDQNGEPVKQRMVFYDIEENSFTWDWEMSKDEGKTWQLQWRIYYERSTAE